MDPRAWDGLGLRLYVLDAAGQPQPTRDLMAWAAWYDGTQRDGSRVVAQDTRPVAGVAIRVSTVFVGVDHGWGPGPPVLWETLVFDGRAVRDGERYRSRAEAEAGHRRWCAEVFGPEEETLEDFAARVDRLLAAVRWRQEGGRMDPETRAALAALKAQEADILRDNARELLIELDDLLAAPHDYALGHGLLGVAQELAEGVARLLLLCELVDGLPPRPEA